MRQVTRILASVALACLAPSLVLAQKRPLNVDDIYNLRDVRDPQRSPDGKWVAFVVARAIKDTDKNDSDVWMASWDGTQEIQLTSSPDSESTPRWSPDNKYLAFLSSRQGAKGGQVWLMNRAGGEAVKQTDVKGGVSDFAWSPDSKRLILVVNEPDPRDPQRRRMRRRIRRSRKPRRPIVINRYHFKEDVSGYLRGERTHLYLFDFATKKAEAAHPGHLRRRVSGLVAGWNPDRVRQQARHRRSRSSATTPTSSSSTPRSGRSRAS